MGFSWDLNDFTNQTWDISGDFSLTDITEIFFYQWPFQDAKLEVPTMYKAYVRPM